MRTVWIPGARVPRGRCARVSGPGECVVFCRTHDTNDGRPRNYKVRRARVCKSVVYAPRARTHVIIEHEIYVYYTYAYATEEKLEGAKSSLRPSENDSG